jgi:arylsulfatase A-like enzyme
MTIASMEGADYEPELAAIRPWGVNSTVDSCVEPHVLSHRHRIAAMAVFLLTVVSWSAARQASAADPEGPVVIYLIDALRADRVSVYGSPRATTPAAERLAAEASVFENAYSVSSWTRASVGTLMTSLLPAEAGVLGRYGRLDPSVPYLPQMFQRRGWKTVAFVSNGNIFDTRTGFSHGFDSFTTVTGTVNPQYLHAIAREVVDPVIEFLQRQTSPRFFLYIHVIDPHEDYYSEQRYKELFPAGESADKMSERERLLLDYDRAIRQADDQFGRIADLLRAKGFWRSATVIYTADHGEEFLEHGGRSHGHTLFEEQIRIPLIIKYPTGQETTGRRRDAVTLADVTPTLAKMFGLEQSARWIGAELRKPLSERRLYFTEDLDSARLFAFRRASRKLVAHLYPTFEVQIYDLARDPGEKAGKTLDCTLSSDPDDKALLALAEQERTKELPFFSELRVERMASQQPLTMDFAANLENVEKPFLTVQDYCAFAPRTKAHALRIREELKAQDSFHLILSADDRGNLAPFRLSAFDGQGQLVDVASERSIFRIEKVTRPRLEGPTTDEVLQNLRNLGYLGGATR